MNRKRTKRDPSITIKEPGSRHQKLLIAIERYGLSDINHLALLTGLSKDNIEYPLWQLFHAGLIDRPSNKVYGRDTNTDPQVYKSNEAGCDWLERQDLLPYRATFIAAGGQAAHNLRVALALASFEIAVASAIWPKMAWTSANSRRSRPRST